MSILESQCLWATHYQFMNDYTEIILFRDKLVEFLLPDIMKLCESILKENPQAQKHVDEFGGLKAVAQHETKSIVNAQYSATGHEIYTTSFAGKGQNEYINENGLLSQWRGYGRDGGIAIVFNTKKMEEHLRRENDKFAYSYLSIQDLVYSDDEEKIKTELSEPLSEIAKYGADLFHSVTFQKKSTMNAEKAYMGFVGCITSYKHRGFKEENEVRIVALPPAHDKDYQERAKVTGTILQQEKERKFRPRNGEHIPYLEIFKDLGSNLPIEKLIVGPHKEKQARASALKVMLRHTDIEVTTSEIPFISV